jgi:hypothetical protein
MEKKANTITVETKNLYGNDLVYPVCDKAKLFASIANTKTLGVYTIVLIKKLGYNFEVIGKVI